MAENIYLFGAGVNKVIEDWHGITPPLANDVFQVAAKLHRLFDHDNYQPMYDYIQQIWHYDKSYLAGNPFNLEECFTLLYSQFNEAGMRGDEPRVSQLATLRLRFSSFLAELLSHFTTFATSSAMTLLSLLPMNWSIVTLIGIGLWVTSLNLMKYNCIERGFLLWYLVLNFMQNLQINFITGRS